MNEPRINVSLTQRQIEALIGNCQVAVLIHMGINPIEPEFSTATYTAVENLELGLSSLKR